LRSASFARWTQAKVAGVIDHVRSEIVNDSRFVNRYFEQRGVENLFALIGETLSDLLSHAGTVERQVLSL
jgi:hypothetical protein